MTIVRNKRGESLRAVAAVCGARSVTVEITFRADAVVLETPATTNVRLVFSRHDIREVIVMLAEQIGMECALTPHAGDTSPGIMTTMLGIPRAETITVRMPRDG